MPEFSPKYAAEVYPVTVDFTRRMTAGATVAASNAQGTTAVTAHLDGTDVSSTLLVADSLATSGTQVQVWVTGGSPGKSYQLRFVAATSDGMLRKSNVTLYVSPD